MSTETKWRPIESAPKEQIVMVWGADWLVPRMARWSFTFGEWESLELSTFKPQPTHWRKPPAAPSATDLLLPTVEVTESDVQFACGVYDGMTESVTDTEAMRSALKTVAFRMNERLAAQRQEQEGNSHG